MALLTALGIPAGLYIASIVSLMQWVVFKEVNGLISMGAGFLAISIYTFHRSSVTVDASVKEHLQSRHLVALRHRTRCIALSIVSGILACSVFIAEHALLGVLPLIGFASILLYGKPILKAPLRTIPILKPLMVGFGISFFGYCLFQWSFPPDIVLAFGLICTADAFLCDVEDIAFDQACGCTTLASKMHHATRVFTAMFFYGVAAILLPIDVGVGFLALSIPFFWQRFINRTYIDVRPVLILLLAWLA